MKVSFIIQFSQPQPGGLYISTINRIKYFIQENRDFDVQVYNIRVKSHSRFKNKTRKCSVQTKSDFNGLIVNNIYYSVGFSERIRNRIFKSYSINYNKKAQEINKYFINADLIAAHYGNLPGIFAYYISEQLKKRFIVTFHGTDIHTTPFSSRGKFELSKRILERSSANIFVSEGLMKKSFEILNTEYKNHVLYNGVDFNLFRKIDSEEIITLKKANNLKEKVVGFVGNLLQVKNVLSLVPIFDYISKKDKNVSFIIIGDGLLRKELEHRFAEREIDVKFFYRVDYENMPLYYNLLNVLVLPSNNEGLPRVIIEALACGVNCVGSRAGGIPELLPEENTFELNDQFETCVSGKVLELLHRKEAVSIEKNRFDFRNIATEQGNIFREVLKIN